MNKELVKMGNQFLGWCESHDTALLTGGAIAGMVTALITSNAATVKTVREFDENPEWDLQTKMLKAVPRYIFPAVAASGSVYCSVKAENVNAARIALLNSAIAASENRFDALTEAIRKELPKSKVEKVENEAHKQEFIKNAPSGDWEETGQGQFYFYEPWHGRKFKSSINAIEKARLKINNELYLRDSASYNDFCYEMHLAATESGAKEGWNVATGYLEINYDHFNWETVNGEDTPVCYMEYVTKPRQDFRNPKRDTKW